MFPQFSTLGAQAPPSGIAASFVLIPLLLEGARRTAGLPIVVRGRRRSFYSGLTAWLLPGDLTGRRVIG